VTVPEAVAVGLVSGLLGAVIGAWATIRATRTQIQANAAELDRHREVEHAEQRKRALADLQAEVKENIALGEKPEQLYWSKVRFSREAWLEHRGETAEWADLHLQLQKAYTLAYRYNVGAEYDMHAVPAGAGSMDESLKTARAEVLEPMKAALATLEQTLNALG
jgi:hypothetical protein